MPEYTRGGLSLCTYTADGASGRHSMKLDLRENGNVNVLVLSGRLTIGAEGQLSEAIDTLLESDRSNILLDLKRVTYMDSARRPPSPASPRRTTRAPDALKVPARRPTPSSLRSTG